MILPRTPDESLVVDVARGLVLLSWAKAERYSEESRKATRSEGDDLEESAARALMRHGGRGRGVRGREVEEPWRERTWSERAAHLSFGAYFLY